MRGLLVSAGLHVAVVAMVRLPGPQYPIVWPTFARDDVIEVTWVDDANATAGTRAPAGQRVAVVRTGMTSGSSATATGSASASHEPAERGHGLMTMRGPELHPGDAVLAHIADAPSYEPRAVPPPRPIGDMVTTVSVDRDGTAHFHDRGDAEAHANLNKPTLARAAREQASYVAAWAEATDPATANDHEHDVVPSCDEHSLFRCFYKYPRVNADGVSLLGGRLDMSSYLMRKAGIDPNAAQKSRLLDESRLDRAERGAQYRSEQAASAGELVQSNLQRVWASTQDADERRTMLFALWDECDEGPGESGEAGERARAMVIGWIRSHITYTAAQIDALNARRTSKQRFEP